VGEFVVLGKPVTTFFESRERAHLEMLVKQVLLYRNVVDLAGALREFQPRTILRTEYEKYAGPKIAMEIFQ
jgi:hypothetical protein